MMKISRKGLGIRTYITSPMRIAICAVILVALIAAVGLWSMRALLFAENFHTVIPKEVYRSAQPSPKTLERRIQERGIHSVINLRGESTKPWFKAERAVTEAQGVDLYHIPLSNCSAPPTNALQELVYLLDTARRPLLLHCAVGIERSGIASAVVVLLAGGDLEEAWEQFGFSYGFVPWYHDHPKILDDYEHWLAEHGWSHTPSRFRHWMKNDYVPYFYRARIEPLDLPTSIAKGSQVVMRFRATNTSPQPWRFRSDRDRGIHLGAKVRLLEPGAGYEFELRGGFHDLTVAPGGTVVLELAIPPFSKAGRYQFLVDLVDEHVMWFHAMGSEPVAFALRVEASDK